MSISLEEAKTLFLSHLLRRGMSPKTIAAYNFDLDHFIQHTESRSGIPAQNYDVSIIDKAHVLSWVDACLIRKNTAKTISRKLSVLKSFFKFLVDEEITISNPAAKIKLPKTKKTIPDAISQDEIRQLIGIISPDEKHALRNRAILILLYSCGLRVSEVTDLKIENFRIDREVIHVLGKGSKERDIPLSKAALKSIAEYLEDRESTEPETVFPKDYLFTAKDGQKMTVRMIQYMVEKYGHAAGLLSHVHPHLIRHSIATHMVEEGADIESVRQTLGHENLATTSIYLKTASKFLKDSHKSYNPTDRLFKKNV